MTTRPPLPPFTQETAIQKVRMAEDGWNSRDPERVALAYALDSRWRNRAEFVNGRQEIVAFLTRKWAKELDYRYDPTSRDYVYNLRTKEYAMGPIHCEPRLTTKRFKMSLWFCNNHVLQ